MELAVIFIISCVISARILEKNKMRAASIAYSVMFVILLSALLFTVDFEPINHAFSRVIGMARYLEVREALLYAMQTPGYGTCIAAALLVTLLLQLLISAAYAVSVIANALKQEKGVYLSKKDKRKTISYTKKIYLRKQINLMYCRMLN